MINEHDIKDIINLYDLNNGDRFKLSEEDEIRVPPASKEYKIDGVFRFDHIDGMYSYCTDTDGAVHHFAAWTKVIRL